MSTLAIQERSSASESGSAVACAPSSPTDSRTAPWASSALIASPSSVTWARRASISPASNSEAPPLSWAAVAGVGDGASVSEPPSRTRSRVTVVIPAATTEARSEDGEGR